jgi:hypothetical protein
VTQYLGVVAFLYDKRAFLGALARMREATINFVIFVSPSVRLSVRPSVRMEQLGSHVTVFHDIWYLMTSSQICREKISLIKI